MSRTKFMGIFLIILGVISVVVGIVRGDMTSSAAMFIGYLVPALLGAMILIVDRIGGGDGFSGGLLYGVLNGWEPEKCLQFGWASGVLAASSLNDYAEPADEKQVWDIYKGNARVQR